MSGGIASGAWIVLGLYFTAMLGIGLWSYRRANASVEGYMLGGRDLGPVVTALSAGASDMSGWLMMGLPGAVLTTGISAGWIGIGLTLGAWTNYRLVAARLRTMTEKMGDAITIPDFLEERFGDTSHLLRLLAAIVIIIFFTLYTSAGMVSGGKFAVSALGIDYHTGLIVTTCVVLIYTLLGGFLAVSLTDFAQGCIMFVGLILVPMVAFGALGSDGLSHGITAAEHANKLAPGAMANLFTGSTILGLISSAAWGLGYFGQPHIIVRFMAIRRVSDLPIARRINISWMSISLIGAILTGYVGAAWQATKGGITDPETVFIHFATILFNPLITGFLLAAILAAIMSTISSQLLVTASSLTEDIYRSLLKRDASEKSAVLIGRAAVLGTAFVAALLARSPDSSVLNLVANAWAGFGAAFGPVILFSLLWRNTTRDGALAGMIVGAATVLLWKSAGWSNSLYEMVPGFILSSAAIWIVSQFTRKPDAARLGLFDESVAAAKGY